MAALPDGRHFFRGDDGYEPARRATVWNQRVPDRYPDVIVQAVDAEDVVATGWSTHAGHDCADLRCEACGLDWSTVAGLTGHDAINGLPAIHEVEVDGEWGAVGKAMVSQLRDKEQAQRSGWAAMKEAC